MKNNSKCQVLSLFLCLGAITSSVVIAKASTHSIGGGSLEGRVIQLERISDAHVQLLTQFQQQFSDLQRDIDTLRGQMQENQYQINQIIEQQKQIYQQIDRLHGKELPVSVPVVTAPESQAGATISVGVTTESEIESGDYNRAVALAIETKQYDQAITALQGFVKQYPQSNYQPNANYWLGQLYYNKGNKDNAIHYYAIVVKNYPKSPKCPDSMLKVGVIMQEKGKKDKARAVYHQLIKLYPDTDAATQAKKNLSGF